MNFNLTKPCKMCPFRSDKKFHGLDRAGEIATSVLNGQAFTCHNTNDYDDDTGEAIVTRKSEHCAGAMIFAENHGTATQMMRIAERLGSYDRNKLSKKIPVYKSVAAMVKGCK